MNISNIPKKYLIITGSAIIVISGVIISIVLYTGPEPAPAPMTREDVEQIDWKEISEMNGPEQQEAMEKIGKRMAVSDADVLREVRRNPETRNTIMNMSDSTRMAFMGQMIKHRKKIMIQEVKDFFKLSPQEQTRHLDKRLDMISEIQKSRDKTIQGENGKNKRKRPGPEQRKEMMRIILAEVEPADRAQVQEYLMRLQDRANERGIELRGPMMRR
jgi:hypothetical protein